MAGTDQRNDPLASFNFVLQVDKVRAGFAEIGGLSTETDIIEYREGCQEITVRKIPGKKKFTNLSLKRGYTPQGKELWQWRKSVLDGKTERRGGTITLQDEAKKATLVWRFIEGWPSKWAGPAFNAKNNEIAIEELEICVEGLALE
jgi:phage tail-like protein